MTLQECIDAVKKEYPLHYPYAFISADDKYIFSIVPKGTDPKKAMSDMHIVDPDTGYISGNISIMELLKDKRFRAAWKNAHLVHEYDKNLSHSLFKSAPVRNGWGMRKKMDDSDFLEHYGIKGQKWGVKNGPPYPLDSKTHNKVVKAKNVEPKEKRAGFILPIITSLAISAFSIAAIALTSTPEAEKRRTERLRKIATDEQNKFDKANKSTSKEIIGDIADVDKNFDSSNMPKKIKGSHTIEDDMAAVNPHYKDGIVPGTSTNCVLCTATYELRRRGYDVTALSSEAGNYNGVIMRRLYKNAKETAFAEETWDKFYSSMPKRYPEGSRGEVCTVGPYMSHSMAWEIKNGKLEIIDAQRNVKVTPSMLTEFGFDPQEFGNTITRLDNKELDPKYINTTSAELKPGWKKTIANERQTKAAGISYSERRRNYEKLWLKEHPDAPNNASSREAMDNWVSAQIDRLG